MALFKSGILTQLFPNLRKVTSVTNNDFFNAFEKAVMIHHNQAKQNPKIDPGHEVGHVLNVFVHGMMALHELTTSEPSKELDAKWIKLYEDCRYLPNHLMHYSQLIVGVACLLHESGDDKFKSYDDNRTSYDRRYAAITESLNEMPEDMKTQEIVETISKMIDYCSASKWGDTYPEGTYLIHLIPRFADRAEATGIIGIVRTMLYGFSVMKTQPLINENDRFPTTYEELKKLAPYESYLKYVESKGKSNSAWEHLMDKIIHLNAKDCPINYINDIFTEGQEYVAKYILDFTNVDGKRWNIGKIIHDPRYNKQLYGKETNRLIDIYESLVHDPMLTNIIVHESKPFERVNSIDFGLN